MLRREEVGLAEGKATCWALTEISSGMATTCAEKERNALRKGGNREDDMRDDDTLYREREAPACRL